jgi:hypothetical protein
MADFDTLSTVHRLKQQIDALTQQQTQALRQATYLGMTTDEAKEYDARRNEITRLARELSSLTQAL